MSDYEKQAEEFCKKTETEITWEYDGFRKHFDDDKEARDCWMFTIKTPSGEYSGGFGASIQSYLDSITAAMTPRDQDDWRKNVPRRDAIYWNSIRASAEKRRKITPPSSYDLLACLQKYDVGTFEDFCAEFGYDDRKLSEFPDVFKTYEACRKEYYSVLRLWPSEADRDALAEIA